jgi:hypothetical protein
VEAGAIALNVQEEERPLMRVGSDEELGGEERRAEKEESCCCTIC